MSLTRLRRPSYDGTTYIPGDRHGRGMSLWEISFRTQYDYPFMKISGRHPGLPISMWCIWNRELVQVPTLDEAILSDIEKEIRKAGKCIDQWVEAADAPPAIFQDGWSHFCLVTCDESHTKDLFRDFNKRGPTELIRKRELPLSVLPSSI